MPGLAPTCLHLTASVGTGQGLAGPDCLDLILHQADEALYSIKRAGAVIA
jgi:GGDEF domain-containing protein